MTDCCAENMASSVVTGVEEAFYLIYGLGDDLLGLKLSGS